jgi:hypothetical protein
MQKYENDPLRVVNNKDGFLVVWLAAGLLVVMCVFAGLAIDAGHGYVVKGELQNAADAGALAGAGILYDTAPDFDWGEAESKAHLFVSKNKADGTDLPNAQVSSGYWRLNQNPNDPLQDKGITVTGHCSGNGTACTLSSDCPTGPPVQTCLIQDFPAIKVTVSKTAGQNGGPVQTHFARVVGWNSFSPSSQAVAVIKPAGTIGPGGLFPVAVAKCFTDNYPIDEDTGESAEAVITSTYHAPPCDSGQWTTLGSQYNNVDDFRSLLQTLNSAPVSVDGSIWIQPGTENTLYEKNDPKDKFPTASDYEGTVVFLPVVEGNDLSTAAWNKIVGFIAFEITDVKGGSSKTITGKFKGGIQSPFASGTGPNFGLLARPALIN